MTFKLLSLIPYLLQTSIWNCRRQISRFSFRDFQQDGIPLWEKKFCTLVGLVPWQKVVDTKNFVSCHSNVLNWNDSAAEEAFQNAKKQYWAEINSLPCDISLPDSDTYIDQIDWNPYIDPELIEDLDRVYCPPPDEEERNAVSYKRTKISADVENSLEFGDTELDKALENKDGWNQCESDKHKNSPSNSEKNANNPWECRVTRENRKLPDNMWEGGGAKAWGRNKVSGHGDDLADWGCGYNAWQNDTKGWGKTWDDNKGWGKAWDNTWNRKKSNNSLKSKGLGNAKLICIIGLQRAEGGETVKKWPWMEASEKCQ
ncbi:uncharacterized protein LOC114733126 isoform X2 [Neltuma alba]|uniref:uncharacterized protein LOC114733126 isoform X2 n=1 Tax=Neltuma alba TaxID=207710 RepID=UPI0010A446DE|nr:uncharacterized protein LOC114733126 isoform X2 [Prosopis alba]